MSELLPLLRNNFEETTTQSRQIEIDERRRKDSPLEAQTNENPSTTEVLNVDRPSEDSPSDGRLDEDEGSTSPPSDKSGNNYFGYMICVTTVFMVAMVRGTAYSFGEFLKELEDEFCTENCQKLLGWVESLSIGLNHLCGPLSLFVLAKGGMMLTFSLGLALCSLGLLISSFASTLNYLFIFYGCMYGLGTSLIYLPPFTILSSEFPPGHPHRVLTTSLITCGSPVGSLVLNPICAKLILHYGWRKSYRILSVTMIIFGSLCLSALTLKRRSTLSCFSIATTNPISTESDKNSKDDLRNKNEDAEMMSAKESFRENYGIFWRRWSLSFWILAQFTSHFSYYIPHVFMVAFVHQRMGESIVKSSFIMSTMGGVEATSRFMSSIFGPKLVGRFLRLQVVAIGILGVCAALEVFADRFWHAAAFCTVQGVMGGFFIASSYPCLLDFDISEKETKTVWSVSNVFMGLAMLTGPPLGGFIHDSCDSYRAIFIFVAISTLLTAVLLSITQLLLKFENDTQFGNCGQQNSPTTHPALIQAEELKRGNGDNLLQRQKPKRDYADLFRQRKKRLCDAHSRDLNILLNEQR